MCFFVPFLYHEPYDLFGIDGIVEWRRSHFYGKESVNRESKSDKSLAST